MHGTFLEKPRQQVLKAQAELDSLSKMRKQACVNSMSSAFTTRPKIKRFIDTKLEDNAELEEDVFSSSDFFDED